MNSDEEKYILYTRYWYLDGPILAESKSQAPQ